MSSRDRNKQLAAETEQFRVDLNTTRPGGVTTVHVGSCFACVERSPKVMMRYLEVTQIVLKNIDL